MSEVPERVYMDPDIKFPECEKRYGCDIEYVRGDLVEAAVKKLGDSLVAAEAKLAKAVDVDLIEQAVDVELIEQAVSDVLYDGGSYRDAAEYVARTILAELKGQDDD